MSKPQGRSALDSALGQLVAMGATDLTEQANRGQLRRAWGREEECREVIAALVDRQSVLLLGLSGAGKTAILHEVIMRIVIRHLPLDLSGWHVLQLSTGAIERGAMNAGMWSGNLQKVLDALMLAKRIILYIDNIWHLRDAGRYSEMVESFATFLRPYLERKDVILIGESTPENYKRSSAHGLSGLALADDPSLMRLFRVIDVEEPERSAVRQILSAVALEFERTYGVQIPSTAVERSMDLAARFQPYQAFPGKGVFLLEEVARAQRQRLDAEKGSGGSSLNPEELILTPDLVMSGFSQLTGLPEKIFSDSIPLRQEEIQSYFAERVVGQRVAVNTIVDLVTLVKAELNDPGRPLGVLLFIGPTGTGKTLMAKSLAEYLFGSAQRLVRFDMSEYQHSDSVPSLANQVVERLRHENFSVLLLDEFEKASPRAFDLFLQAFDEARLTDSTGRTVDLRNTIVILTSNLGGGAASPPKSRPIGFMAADDRVPPPQELLVREVEGYFRPEFVNRLDKIVVFRPLDVEAMRRIARRELGKALVREGMTRRNILLDFRDDVLDLLVKEGFSEQYGARPLQRAIKELVLVPLARRIAARPASGDQLLELHGEGQRVDIVRIPYSVSQPEDTHQSYSHSEVATGRSGGMDLRRLSEAIETLRRRLNEHGESGRFRGLESRSQQLLEEIAKPSFWDDQVRSRQTLTTIHYLERITDLFAALRSRADALAEVAVHIRRYRRIGEVDRLENRYRALESDVTLAELELLVSQAEPGATTAAFICISPMSRLGALGTDDWTRALENMYVAWARRKGYGVEIINEDGASEVVLVVHGPSVFPILQGETGIHKRQIAAVDAGERRAATVQLAKVQVLPLMQFARDRLPFARDEVSISVVRESPPRAQSHSVKLVEGFHRAGNVRVRVQGEDAEHLTLALLAASLESRRSPIGRDPELARVYNFVRNQYARDPRTGARTTRAREVLAGGIDPFLIAYLRKLRPDAVQTETDDTVKG